MKKLLLLLLVFVSCLANSQSDMLTVLPKSVGSQSSNGRIPQGARPATRSVWIITTAEMTAAGFVNGDVINALGFETLVAQNLATTGTISIYLQNTADATNLKSSTWATAITGMDNVSTGAYTIPATVGTFDYAFNGLPFTYTGTNLYVAFDYQNFSNPLATATNIAACKTDLALGIKSVLALVSDTVPPATLQATASSFRPSTRLGKAVTCSRPTNVAEVIASKTASSITLSWSNSSASSIIYGPYNFATGTGITVSNVISPYTITGLNASTVYEFYVQNNCGTTVAPVLSAETDYFPSNTVFAPSAAPYDTSFEQENLPFIGWATGTNTPVGSSWQNYITTAPDTLTHNGTTSIFSLSGVTTAPANNWLLSRGVNLTAGYQATISFYVRNYVDGTPLPSTSTSSYNLTVGTTQTTAAQTLNIGSETGLNSTTYVLKTYNYTVPATGSYYFGIQNVSPINTVGRQGLFLDDFTVSESLLSTDNFLKDAFSVSPNPANSIVKISNTQDINVSAISITDLNGRVVKNASYENVSNVEVNISDLTAGVYMINVKTDSGSVNKKIIKL